MEWELSDKGIRKGVGRRCKIDIDVEDTDRAIVKIAQKKLIEVIKKDTDDNLFAISDELWQSLCKKLGVK